MNGLSVLWSNLSQLLPGLLAFGGALLWFVQRAQVPPHLPRPSRWWGALAGLAVLAVPSVMGHVIQFVGLGLSNRQNLSFLVLTTLPTAAVWLAVSAVIVLACLTQREEPLQRSVASAMLFGWVLRELILLLLLGVALLLNWHL